MKIVKSDRRGEHCGRYTENGQYLGPFAKFLGRRDICAQYTMSGTPKQNSVVERRNCTLMDMVRSMLSYSSLPLSLWMEALKAATYLLNRILIKVVLKTLFDLRMEKRPNLRHMHVWGCREELKSYNPHERKLDSRTTSRYLIGYPKNLKGIDFIILTIV